MSIGQFSTLGFQNQQSVTAEYIYVVNKGGIFVYNGSAGLGNLVASVTTQTTDKYGNHTIPLAYASYDTPTATAIGAGQLIWFTGSLTVGWTPVITFGLAGSNLQYLSMFGESGTDFEGLIIGSNLGALNIIFPSGDTTGATDYANISSQLSAASANVMLVPGIYYINQTLQIPNECGLYGMNSAFGVPIGNYGAGSLPLQGSILTCTNTFANPNSGTGCVLMESTTGQGGGQRVQGITLDASNLPSGNNLHGIAVFNSIAAATIQYNTVYGGSGGAAGSLGGDCIHASASPSQPPDLLTIMHNHFAGGSGWGAVINGVADSYVAFNESTGNQLGGWNLTNGNNSRYVSNKGEQSKAGPGWKVTFATGFTGILHMLTNTCQDNFEDGIQITGPGTGYLKISDFAYDSDGQNTGGAGGGGFGGVNINNFAGTVQLELLAGRVGTAYPEYGLTITNLTGTVQLDNIIAAAITNGFNWDYSGTVILGDYVFTPASPNSTWVIVGSAGAPAFGAGWSNNAGNIPCRFRREGPYSVYLAGGVANSVAANAAAIFQLPAKYRPAFQHVLPLVENGNVYGNSIVVQTGGNVIPFNNAGAGNYWFAGRVDLD